MFFVYYGYLSPDTDSEHPSHNIKVCRSEHEVEEFYKEFKENLYSECGAVEFRVFKGEELALVPVEVVTAYELKRKV